MLIVEKYSPADHSADVNQKFEYLENRGQMLTEEISKTSIWKVSKIVSLRRRIRKVDQDRNDLMCNNGLIYYACSLEL
jgi:hypothetical protein